ncbi:hypothetical protein K402DRAFT_452501 [Aulographum hederae CBS 113979]|uniref:Uncharacterized protein n=1 Tax=Aulographum hederae CBS 113979 TaxID=1176131 RepID=A0A6G1H679_9PEZI|nr:hypothetical protein K402DRAFT_452501 [Aulographum hederae CBS 113979]
MVLLSTSSLAILLASSAYAVRINKRQPLLRSAGSKRDVCNLSDRNFEPILWHEYGEADCPVERHMREGHCPPADDDGSNMSDICMGFCQVRTWFHQEKEQPIINSYCHGPFTCTITDTHTDTWTWNGGIKLDGSILKVLSLGISGGLSVASAMMHSTAFQVHLNPNECGYFTMLPIVKEVCGTLTEWGIDRVEQEYCGGDWMQPGVQPANDWANYCVQEPKSPEGKLDTDTIFVRTDCVTREPLELQFQDQLFQAHPELLLDRGVVAERIQDFLRSVGSGGVIGGTALDENGGQGSG